MYIITYWNHMKRKVSYLECESEEEVNTVLKVMERNGWVKKNGVWYHNIEAQPILTRESPCGPFGRSGGIKYSLKIKWL